MTGRVGPEKGYLLRIRSREIPFSQEPTEEMTYSKEHRNFRQIEIHRTCFCFLKKSNRTLNRTDKKEEAESEQNHHAATKIINCIDPTTLISGNSSNSRISSHLSSILKIEKGNMLLDEDERKLVEDAIKVHDEGDFSFLISTEPLSVGDEEHDNWDRDVDL